MSRRIPSGLRRSHAGDSDAMVPALMLPKLGPLGASFSDDVVLAPAPGDPNPATLRGPTAFGDDVPTGRRIAVRVRLTQEHDTLVFDYRDSDPIADGVPNLALSPAQVVEATRVAIARALDLTADSTSAPPAFEVDTAPQAWVGGARDEPSRDDAAVCMAMSRVFDAALGAMANAWPSKVGAGSNTLGAIVDLFDGDTRSRDVVPGGEGATPRADGASAWTGPFAPSVSERPPWLSVDAQPRPRSGGVGARNGGNGVTYSYTTSRTVEVAVAIDRITNPPHGIDRAGPPQPAELWLATPNEARRRISPWIRHPLPAGGTLTVKTAGGAGHGFPGWGVDWDPESF